MPVKKAMPREIPAKKSSRGETSGWGALAKKQREAEIRKEEMESKIHEFWLPGGESAIVQILSKEPYAYGSHSVKGGRRDFERTPCQLMTKKHCVLCADGNKAMDVFAFKVLDYRGSYDSKTKKFKHDKPIEKVWLCGLRLAQQLKSFSDRQDKDLTELVVLITKNGSGKDTTYSVELARDDDDKRMRPLDWDETFPDLEEICEPLSDDEIAERGYF